MSVSLETLDKMKAELRQVKDLGMPIQQDLYTHLTEVFNRIMMHHPKDAFEKFEDISALVKRTNFKIKDPEYDHLVNEKAGVVTNKQALEFIERVKNLLRDHPDMVKPEDRKLVSNLASTKMQNFVQCADMLELAGVGFGEDMNILIQKSLKRLAMLSGASQVKFFGKILCQEKDYWVAQGVLSQPEEAVRNKLQEPRGKGVN